MKYAKACFYIRSRLQAPGCGVSFGGGHHSTTTLTLTGADMVSAEPPELGFVPVTQRTWQRSTSGAALPAVSRIQPGGIPS